MNAFGCCPGSQMIDRRERGEEQGGATGKVASQLRQWPIQLRLS